MLACCCRLGRRLIAVFILVAQARKLESELDAKLAAYGKICTGYDSSYASKRGEAGLANDQVSASPCPC